jgi:hypothetical protein
MTINYPLALTHVLLYTEINAVTRIITNTNTEGVRMASGYKKADCGVDPNTGWGNNEPRSLKDTLSEFALLAFAWGVTFGPLVYHIIRTW